MVGERFVCSHVATDERMLDDESQLEMKGE